MKKNILWVEDDFYAINGLVRPLEKDGFSIQVATSAIDAYQQAKNWRKFDLLIIDLIIPLSNDNQEIPAKVKAWENELYMGIGVAKWLIYELNVKCPLLILSVASNPIPTSNLGEHKNLHYLSKKGLLPSKVKETVMNILAI